MTNNHTKATDTCLVSIYNRQPFINHTTLWKSSVENTIKTSLRLCLTSRHVNWKNFPVEITSQYLLKTSLFTSGARWVSH